MPNITDKVSNNEDSITTNIPSSLGTAGQVLTVNSGATAGEWADAGGGGLHTHLQTITLNNDSSAILNASAISNYSSAKIILDSVNWGTSQYELRFRFQTGGNTITSSVYGWSFHGTNLGSRIGGGQQNDSYGSLTSGNGSYMPTEQFGGEIFCTGMAPNHRSSIVSRLGGGKGTTEDATAYNSTVTIDNTSGQISGFVFFPSGGSFVSGKISIYGINEND